MSLYIGLMSGTSMDGVDAALVSFAEKNLEVIGRITTEYPPALRKALTRAVRPDAALTLSEFGRLNVNIGIAFADTTNELLAQTQTRRQAVTAIGSHGQTVHHDPNGRPPYTIQLGDPATIAIRSGILTVADFRSIDVAAGGQGAPLVPPFHREYFQHPEHDVVVVNIGGIANVTLLPAGNGVDIEGFDTGPGNCLLDDWINLNLEQAYDESGRWAASGKLSHSLLDTLMADEYLALPSPKSTGREHFNLVYLQHAIQSSRAQILPTQDVQATLAAFTVASISEGISQAELQPARIIVCGGGTKNCVLMQGLAAAFPNAIVASSSALGVDPDMVEALAFAWLAKQRVETTPVRLTTGLPRNGQVLGAIYDPFGIPSM